MKVRIGEFQQSVRYPPGPGWRRPSFSERTQVLPMLAVLSSSLQVCGFPCSAPGDVGPPAVRTAQMAEPRRSPCSNHISSLWTGPLGHLQLGCPQHGRRKERGGTHPGQLACPVPCSDGRAKGRPRQRVRAAQGSWGRCRACILPPSSPQDKPALWPPRWHQRPRTSPSNQAQTSDGPWLTLPAMAPRAHIL